MESKVITADQVVQKYNISRTSLQKYLRTDEKLLKTSKKVFGRRIFDVKKFENWYNDKITI